MADLVGKTLGVYRLENSLGRGGMATVYRAYQATIKRYVAIKVMAADIANDPGFVERFSREAEVIASLQHPHILPVIDYGEADGVHYLVMRYLDGGSLEDRMRKKPLTLKESARFIEQIASALDYAHKRGVIHRDFKASNVLLDDENNTYLTDFGIARLAGNTSKLTATGTVMGTPAYMSPEQAMGKPVDGRSDIYSLGVVIYEMITRRLPFVADTPAALVFQHVYEQPVPPRRLNSAIPEALEAVILRTLAKDPDERFQTASDMSAAFNEAIQSSVAVSAAEEMEGTMVGGPSSPLFTPLPGRGTSPKPPVASGAGSTASINRAATDRNKSASITADSSNAIDSAALAGSTGKFPIALIAGVVILLLLLIGGGLAIVGVSGQNNSNSTNTAVAIAAAATQSVVPTQVAVIAPTTTATNTPTTIIVTSTTAASATPTTTASAINTATNTLSPTVTFTESPNATLTSVVLQMNTVAAFQAGQTATQQQNAIAAGTAAAQQIIAQVVSQTSAALTATAVAKVPSATNIPPLATPVLITTPTDTPFSTTVADNSGAKYVGAPATVMAALQNDGLITAITGQVALQPFNTKLTASDPSFIAWQSPEPSLSFGDFVISARISWDHANSDDACGILFRFNKPSPNINAFYGAYIDPGGHFTAITHVTNKDDVSTVNTTSALINTDAKATNDLLVIGQGNAFRVFVNGKRVASFSPKTRFDGGGLTVSAYSGLKSGLVCHFSNIWAWQLSAASGTSNGGGSVGNSGDITPGAGSTDLASGLMSSTPENVIGALELANLIPAKAATQVVQLPLDQLSVSTYKANQGGQYYQLTNKTIKNLVLSVDLTIDMPEDGYCGLYFNGDASTSLSYLTAIFLESTANYEAFDRVNGAWSTKTVPGSTGTSQLFVIDGTTNNRLTLIVQNSQVTLYVNGTLLVSFTDHTLDNQNGGAVGYYLGKYKSSVNTDSCIYRNATLWQLP